MQKRKRISTWLLTFLAALVIVYSVPEGACAVNLHQVNSYTTNGLTYTIFDSDPVIEKSFYDHVSLNNKNTIAWEYKTMRTETYIRVQGDVPGQPRDGFRIMPGNTGGYTVNMMQLGRRETLSVSVGASAGVEFANVTVNLNIPLDPFGYDGNLAPGAGTYFVSTTGTTGGRYRMKGDVTYVITTYRTIRRYNKNAGKATQPKWGEWELMCHNTNTKNIEVREHSFKLYRVGPYTSDPLYYKDVVKY